jgi:hypothetical protein
MKMTIESELLLIKGNAELLQAEPVVSWAKTHPKSELHKQFEWDDRKAGHEYRIWQARRIIAIHITYADGERKFVSLTPDRSRTGGGYRDVDDVLRDKALHEIMLADALAQLSRIQAQYDRLQQLKPVWREVAKVRRRQRGRQKGGEQTKQA